MGLNGIKKQEPEKKYKEKTKKVKNTVPLILGSPDVKGLKLPDHAVRCVKDYGNTVISNTLYKKAGILGLQKLFSNAGIRVSVDLTDSENCIVSEIHDGLEFK